MLTRIVLVEYFYNARVEAAQIYAAVGPGDAKVGVPLDLFPVWLQLVIIAELIKHSVEGFFVKHNLPAASSCCSLGRILAEYFTGSGSAVVGLFATIHPNYGEG